MWNVRHFLISNENKSFYKKNKTKNNKTLREVGKFSLCVCSALENNHVINHNLNKYRLIWSFKVSIWCHLHMCYIYFDQVLYFLGAYPFGFKFHKCRNRKSLQTTTCLYMFPSSVRICPLIHLTMQSMHTCITCLVDKRKSNQHIDNISPLWLHTNIIKHFICWKCILWLTKFNL